MGYLNNKILYARCTFHEKMKFIYEINQQINEWIMDMLRINVFKYVIHCVIYLNSVTFFFKQCNGKMHLDFELSRASEH